MRYTPRRIPPAIAKKKPSAAFDHAEIDLGMYVEEIRLYPREHFADPCIGAFIRCSIAG